MISAAEGLRFEKAFKQYTLEALELLENVLENKTEGLELTEVREEQIKAHFTKNYKVRFWEVMFWVMSGYLEAVQADGNLEDHDISDCFRQAAIHYLPTAVALETEIIELMMKRDAERNQ